MVRDRGRNAEWRLEDRRVTSRKEGLVRRIARDEVRDEVWEVEQELLRGAESPVGFRGRRM